MPENSNLQQSWAMRRSASSSLKLAFSDRGITLGAGTLLLRFQSDEQAIEDDSARAACLLRFAAKRNFDCDIVVRLRKALRSWQDGDKALAQIRIAQAGLVLDSEEAAWRLFLAETILDRGMRPAELLRELSKADSSVTKGYNENEPRNPIGAGRESGRWTKSPASSVEIPTNSPDPREPSAGQQTDAFVRTVGVGLLDDLSPSALEWLATAASRLAGPATFFGAMVIPAPNPGVVNEGLLPGQSDIAYRIDNDTGTLRLSSKGDTDPEDAIVGVLGRDGLYRQVDSGAAIGRVLPGGAVVIDLGEEAIPDPYPDPDPGPSGGRRPPPASSPPKLCPDPGPDAGRHYGFSAEYELYVRDHVNPQRIPQLPVGLTFALPSTIQPGWTYYDDCQESTGRMIEAKSDESGFMLGKFGQQQVAKRYLAQAQKQVRDAAGRPVDWYLHWKKAASMAEALFRSHNLPIRVHYLPYPGRPQR